MCRARSSLELSDVSTSIASLSLPSTNTAPNVHGTDSEGSAVHKTSQYMDSTPRNQTHTYNKSVPHNSLNTSHFLILRAPHLRHGYLTTHSHTDSYPPQNRTQTETPSTSVHNRCLKLVLGELDRGGDVCAGILRKRKMWRKSAIRDEMPEL